MTPTAQQLLGRRGEQLALAHYERLGFAPLACNHRSRSGELDLIVADAGTIVFVEVKTASVRGLDPLVSITPRMLARLRRLAGEFLAGRAPPGARRAVRIDVVAVVLDAGGALVSLEQFADV